MRGVGSILKAIAHFDPSRSSRRETGREWLDLDELIQELSAVSPPCLEAVPVLLGVFERFPRHDGYEVFWSLLHYIEHVPGHEGHLIQSFRRRPNHMTTTMLQRWINSGATNFEEIDLRELLREVEPLAPEVTFEV